MAAHVPRINRRVLTVFLLVALPVLVVGVGLVLAVGQARLNDTYGKHLEQVAKQTAANVDTYVSRRILDTSQLGRAPTLRNEAALWSAKPFDRARMGELDAAWSAKADMSPDEKALLATPASRFLADLVAHDGAYREMLLTDRMGRLVAASGRTSDYFQGDEDWWKAAFDDGRRGRPSVSDVQWDESARTYAIQIAVPVYGSDNDTLAGILKVVTDSGELLVGVAGVQLGTTGEAVLLRSNGSIVFARRPASPDARFFATEDMKREVQQWRSGAPLAGAWFRAAGPDGRVQLVGLAECQLERRFPTLAWTVAVYQAESELTRPVMALAGYLLLLLVLVAAVVLALALYFSMRLAAPQVDVDMALEPHPHVAHVGEVDEEAASPGQRPH